MEESDVDSGQAISWQVVQNQDVNGEQMEGPLLVAMQPGSDVPAVESVEVVVMTENGEEIDENEIQTVVDAHTGEVVAIGAIEEVHEERLLEAAEYIPSSDNKGGRGGQQSSSESSEEDSSEAESEEEQSRKKPKQRDFAYRLQWKSKDMQDAMKAVSEKRITIRGAAKKFRVPYSTLKDRVHGRVKHGTKPGVKTALSPEEEEDLVRYIKDMESSGFQLRCIDVRDRAGEILQLNHGHNSPYKDSSPGHNWLAGFLKRHPGLEFKKAMNRSVIPSLAKQKAMCRRFFEVTSQVYKKHRLSHKPERIYTMTEMRVDFFLEATILMCASADGTQIPPFVIFHGQRLKLTSARDAYPDAFFTCSYDGRVNDVVLLWWFRDHFLKKIPSTNHRPCILFLSRSVGEVTFQLTQLAREERVSIVSIPPGISHVLQPLDESIARTIESAIIKKAKKWEEENPATAFSQKVLAQILQKVWRKGIDSVDISAKFAANGVFPCNSLAITYDRITAACQALKERQKSPSPSTMSNSAQFSGLSLLSALSSHEYASLEHIYGNNDSPTKQQGVLEVEETYEPPEKVTPVRHGKRKRGERHERDRQKQLIMQDIEKIIEEAKGRTSDHTGKSVLATLMEEPPLKDDRKQSQPEESQPSLTQELLGAKENFEQINRAIESIGGSVGQSDDATGGRVVTVSTNEDSTVEEIVEEVPGSLNPDLIRVYDQEGNEVMVHEVQEVLSEEVISEPMDSLVPSQKDEVVLCDEQQVEEEIVEEQLTLHEQPMTMEQIITHTDPSGQEMIMHSLANSHQDMVSDQTQYVAVNDTSGVIDAQTYAESMQTDQFLEPEVQPQQYQLFEEEAQNIQLLQQQHQQELQTVVATTSTTKSRGRGGPKVRILRPKIQVVKAPHVAKSARVIKLIQPPGSAAVQLDMAQLQQILQLSGNSQIISGVSSGSSDNIVMLSEDCAQEVVLE